MEPGQSEQFFAITRQHGNEYHELKRIKSSKQYLSAWSKFDEWMDKQEDFPRDKLCPRVLLYVNFNKSAYLTYIFEEKNETSLFNVI